MDFFKKVKYKIAINNYKDTPHILNGITIWWVCRSVHYSSNHSLVAITFGMAVLCKNKKKKNLSTNGQNFYVTLSIKISNNLLSGLKYKVLFRTW